MITTLTQSLLAWKILMAKQYDSNYITFFRDQVPLALAERVRNQLEEIINNTDGLCSSSLIEAEFTDSTPRT